MKTKGVSKSFDLSNQTDRIPITEMRNAAKERGSMGKAKKVNWGTLCYSSDDIKQLYQQICNLVGNSGYRYL